MKRVACGTLYSLMVGFLINRRKLMDNKKDIVDRLMLKSPLHNLTSYELVEAANEITRLRKELAEIKNSRRTHED
tara:strand:+ start:1264 stop:1488 length:225 start_codon:yes stop_codon:yes gene_type:complete